MNPGVELERDCALIDAKEFIDERGDEIILNVSLESDVTRDRYGSIKKHSPSEIVMCAFPIEFNPTDGRLEKAGIKENIDLMITLSQKDFIDNDLTIDDIDDIRWRVVVKGKTYSIKDKNEINQMADTYLNIVLGLFHV